MRKAMLLVPAFAGTFVLGRSVGQEVQTFCDDCESTYISAEEIQEYLEVVSADQQVRSVDIGKVQVQVAISHRGRLERPGGVAEHDLVTEVYLCDQRIRDERDGLPARHHIRYVMIRIDPDKVVPLKDEADSREYLRNR